MPKSPDWLSDLLVGAKQLLGNRLILLLVILVTGVEIVNTSVMPALITHEKAVERQALADNSKMRQQGEAALAEQKALTDSAIAANAPQKEAADARRLKAAALKTAADAEVANAEASLADVTSPAAAAAKAALADLTTQQAAIERETARQAARLLRASTESEQIAVAQGHLQNMWLKSIVGICTDCDPTYCILCTPHYVPDLPSGAELPPAEAGEEPQREPPRPKLTVLVDRFNFERTSPCDRDYQIFKATPPYSAYATGRRGCDYVAGQKDLATARAGAIRKCGHADCFVVAQITPMHGPRTAADGKAMLVRSEPTSFPLGGSCRRSFDEWKRQDFFGAFAVGHSHCGWSSEAADPEQATRDALAMCSDRDCRVVYVVNSDKAMPATTAAAQPALLAAPNAVTRSSATSGSDDVGSGTVVPLELNVHSRPSSDAATVIGKLAHGQHVAIRAGGEGDFIAIEATCIDGKPCRGFVNGRAEFIAR